MYNVRAALPVRIWDYFIYSSAEQANKLDRICNYFICLRSILSICSMCGLQYMSVFGIILSIYLEQANKLNGIWYYFIYLSAEQAKGLFYLYDVRAAVNARIWDYFIYLSAEPTNKSDGIWHYFYVLMEQENKSGLFYLGTYWRSVQINSAELGIILFGYWRSGQINQHYFTYLFICGAGK
jgi:hypothetical protein